MRVWFEAPERFRLDVVDRTTDRRTATPTDLRLIVDEDEWYVAAPAPCPVATCPMRATAVRNRVPFSSSAPAPTDLVLPLTALADADDVEVLGTATVLGREAIRVQLAVRARRVALPVPVARRRLATVLRRDRVRIWLDAESWFPLRWEVLPDAPAPGARRGRSGSGCRRSPRRARSSPSRPTPHDSTVRRRACSTSRRPRIVRDHMARGGRRSTEVEEAAGFAPVMPAETGGSSRIARSSSRPRPSAGASV